MICRLVSLNSYQNWWRVKQKRQGKGFSDHSDKKKKTASSAASLADERGLGLQEEKKNVPGRRFLCFVKFCERIEITRIKSKL